MKISSISIRSETKTNIKDGFIYPSNLNILIGANNSGKSLFLREVLQHVKHPSAFSKIIETIEVPLSEASALNGLIARCVGSPPTGQVQPSTEARWYGKMGSGQWIENRQIEQIKSHPDQSMRLIRQWFMAHRAVSLDGETRLSLSQPCNAADLRSEPISVIQRLYADDRLRVRFRKYIKRVLQVNAVIDPTAMAKLHFAIAPEGDVPYELEHSISGESVAFFDTCQRVSDASDGSKAVFGILASLIADDADIYLIDEPEAFLHPAVSESLGFVIGEISKEQDTQIFVATHSSNFLKGILHGSKDASVFRFSFRNNLGSIKSVGAEDVRAISGNSLIRSTKALSGVFYDYPIVVESDTDAAFYDELAYSGDSEKPRPRVFLNARSKQTIPEILGPLRALGSQAAAIVDLDFLNDHGAELTKWFEAVSITQGARDGFRAQLATIRSKVKEQGIDLKKCGIEGVSDALLKHDIVDVVQRLESHGVFLVRVGELERLLPDVFGKGPHWLKKAFDFIETNPASSDVADARAFIERVFEWQGRAV